MNRIAAVLVCGLVALAALIEYAALFGEDRTLAPDVVAAVAWLKAQPEPLSKVRLHHSPLFNASARAALKGLSISPDHPTPRQLARSPVWVLDDINAPMVIDAPESMRKVFGTLVVRQFAPVARAGDVFYDLLQDLGADTLRIERPLGRISSKCRARRPAGGFSCPGEAEWLYIAPADFRIGGSDRACVWAHPTAGGAIIFTIPPVSSAQARAQLSVDGAFNDDAVVSTPDGAAVTVKVRQPTKTAAAHLTTFSVPNKMGFVTRTVAIDPRERTEIVVTAPRDGRRHFCLNARVEAQP